MTKKDEKVIQILSKVGEDIDSFSINDTDEWSRMVVLFLIIFKFVSHMCLPNLSFTTYIRFLFSIRY